MHTVAKLLMAVAFLASAQPRVVDLRDAPIKRGRWKIATREVSGSVCPSAGACEGAVQIQLADCTITGSDLDFSLKIDNTQAATLELPVGTDATRFEHPGVVRFRQLHIALATGTEPATGTESEGVVVIRAPAIQSLILFGDRAVPGALAQLAPGEQLLLRLRTQLKGEHPGARPLRAEISGFDVTISPIEDGAYHLASMSIQALFAALQPCEIVTR